MPNFNNNNVLGRTEYWADDWSISVADNGEISCNATYISRFPNIPVGFTIEPNLESEEGFILVTENDVEMSNENVLDYSSSMPNTGFRTLHLSSYSIKDYNGGLYAISCVFKSTIKEEEEETGEDYGETGDSDGEEKKFTTWTITGSLETRPLEEHSRFQNFNGKALSTAFTMLTDGKIDAGEFFKNQKIVPLNPNDFKFNPLLYTDCFDIVNRSSDEFLNRLVRGNDIFYSPKYHVSINSIGENPVETAFGLDNLMGQTGMSFEMTNTETVTENGVANTTTNLESINPNDND